MKLALAALLACGLAQGVPVVRGVVMFKPLDAKGLLRVVGPNRRHFSGWVVEVVAGSQPLQVSKESLMLQAPDIHELPADLAKDVMARAAASDTKSFVVEGISETLVLGSAAAAFKLKSPQATYVLSGSAILGVIVRILGRHKPDPTPYFGDLLPDEVNLKPNEGGTWYVISQYVSHQTTLGPFPIVVEYAIPPAQ